MASTPKYDAKAAAAPAPLPVEPTDAPVAARTQILQKERRKSGVQSTVLSAQTRGTILGSPITQ